MTDRPAVELLAEIDRKLGAYGFALIDVAMHRDILERLARAEQALADIKAACDTYGGFPIITLERVRTAFRASQEDSDG